MAGPEKERWEGNPSKPAHALPPRCTATQPHCTLCLPDAWQVEEFRYPESLYRMTFSFRENPYFQNEVVLKEYQLNIPGKMHISLTRGASIAGSWLDRIGCVLTCPNSSRIRGN